LKFESNRNTRQFTTIYKFPISTNIYLPTNTIYKKKSTYKYYLQRKNLSTNTIYKSTNANTNFSE